MTYALEEGGRRLVGHGAQRLQGEDGRVVAVERSLVGPPPDFEPVPGSAFKHPADLVLIAVGFLHAEHEGLLGDLGLALDPAGNVATAGFASSAPGIFAAGDAHTGQSLVVSAIAEGRDCAEAVDAYLNAD